MGFRPTFWATMVTVPALLVLLGLGTWQVQRLHWKSELIAVRTDRVAAPPLALADIPANPAGLAGVEYRPVAVSGELRNDLAMHLLNRVRNGRAGGHLVAPMALGDGRGTVMIDRGWMPLPALRAFRSAAPERTTVEGFVRLYAAPGYFVPENEPAANNWFFMDEAGMLDAAGLAGPVGFYVQAGPDSMPPGAFPAGSAPEVNLRNAHLGYAVTWYGLALVLAVIFVAYHRQRREA